MKLKTLILIVFCIWLVDYASTVIGVGILGGRLELSESNPLAKSFYDKGLIGWVSFPLFALFVLSIYSLVTFFGEKLCIWICKKKNKIQLIRYSWVIPALQITTWGILEGIVIINNIYLIFSSL